MTDAGGVLRTAGARASLLCLICLLLAPALGARAHAQTAQQDLRRSQQKLDSIQQERQRLQGEMEKLKTSVRSASRELVNIEKQQQASKSALLELEHQATLLAENVTNTEAELEETQNRLSVRTRDLQARLRAIYKRGPVHAVRVLLTAESFADLLNRYKYLHMITLYERMMIQDVARLEQNLVKQQTQLRSTLFSLDQLRDEKADEVSQLVRVERQRQSTLKDYRARESRAASQLDQLTKEQARLTDQVAALEKRRRDNEAAGGSTTSTLSTRDLGQLDWPVEGNLVYRFGPDTKENGIVLKNNGIGIAAPAGTPVKAVEAGTVELAGSFPGYGPTVIVSHGAGYRTLYLFLKQVRVTVGQKIDAGAIVGTVGGEQTPEGSHIEFQVRIPLQPGTIEAVDPLSWLRSRAGR